MNNFLVCSPICMKFVTNSSVLEILPFWLGITVSDPFPLSIFQNQNYFLFWYKIPANKQSMLVLLSTTRSNISLLEFLTTLA